MATAAPLALDRRTVPWLLASALATTGPHLPELPEALAAVVALFFAWGAWLWWRGARLPGRWLLALCVAAYSAGILLEYRTLLGRDTGVAMLAGFMALKVMEIRSRRDAYVMVTLGYFLLLTHYFYSQSIPTGLWLIVNCVLLTATLIRMAGGERCTPLPTLRYAGLLVLQSLPFMLALYLLFPRVNGPLWGLPQDAHKASSGLSDTMAPGTISDLAQSAEIAFRVRFEGDPPTRDQLYWRGPVMERYDGLTWSQPVGRFREALPAVQFIGKTYAYELTLEPHNQAWVLALDAPAKLPPATRINSAMSVLAERPVQQRTRYSLTAHPGYRFNPQESPTVLERNLALPPGRNPRAIALAKGWRQEAKTPEQIVERSLTLFREQPFVYTLRPPLLGENGVDDFLFSTRRGFCEHYASAFVVLMRAAGIPARVVGGYQGGEANPLDGYYVIRQSDAHAWAEVWLPDQGWRRVDPTAAVSPARIESSIADALPAGEPLPALVQINATWLRDMRFRWEAINNAWNQYVLGYNPDRQRELLSRLGLQGADWKALSALLAAICGGLLLVVTAWALYHRPRPDPALREWRKALRHLHRLQIEVAPWEGPLALATRLHAEHPRLAPAFRTVAEQYCRARYQNDAAALSALKTAVRALPRWRMV